METLIVFETTPVVEWLACSPRVWQIIGSSPDRVKPKTIKLVFVASPLNTQLYEKEQRLVGSESGYIMCPSAVTFLSADCCFSELAL